MFDCQTGAQKYMSHYNIITRLYYYINILPYFISNESLYKVT